MSLGVYRIQCCLLTYRSQDLPALNLEPSSLLTLELLTPCVMVQRSILFSLSERKATSCNVLGG